MLAATTLFAMWLSLFVSYDRLWKIAFEYRIVRQKAALERAAEILSQQWPEQSIALPELGNYEACDFLGPDVLFIEELGVDSLTTFRERFFRIDRGENGDICFIVESKTDCRVHRIGEGRELQSFTRSNDLLECHWQLQHTVDLGDGLYLAYYDMIFSDPPSLADPIGQPDEQSSAE